MKPLEIPYNFDKNLISMLFQIDPTGEKYSCIYLPPYQYDYIGAKHNYTHNDFNSVNANFPKTREEYISHVEYIKEFFPNKLMLLLQRTDSCISKSLLYWYYTLGFKNFCVGSVEQAKQIRALFDDVIIIGSITMKITPKNLEDQKYNIFDGFVLFFPFNRDLNSIKNLPKNYKYILLVNCDCDVSCEGTHHWFASQEEEKCSLQKCPHSYRENSWENSIRIRPMDLSIFDSYISSYKLQGREYTTANLLKDVYIYSINWMGYPTSSFGNENLYKKNI